MLHPTKSNFRRLALGGIILIVISAVMSMTNFPEPAEDVRNVLDWNYHGSLIPPSRQTTLYHLYLIIQSAGFMGFICFQSWSRWLLLATFAAIDLMDLVSGLYVSTGVTNAIYNLGWLLFSFPFILSFFPPCSGYFEAKRLRSQPEKSPGDGA